MFFVGSKAFNSYKQLLKRNSAKEKSLLSQSPSFLFVHSFTLPLPSHLTFLFPSSRASFHYYLPLV